MQRCMAVVPGGHGHSWVGRYLPIKRLDNDSAGVTKYLKSYFALLIYFKFGWPMQNNSDYFVKYLGNIW